MGLTSDEVSLRVLVVNASSHFLKNTLLLTLCHYR